MLNVNFEAMEDKIFDIITDLLRDDISKTEAIDKLLNLHSVSKRFEIDFEGAVLADIEITNNEPKIHRGVNGYGIGVNPDKCKIKRVK